VAGKKKEPPVLDGEVIAAGSTVLLGVSREQLADLAAAWEQAAGGMGTDAGLALANAGGLGDLALVMLTGTVANVRADALRDCAADLRALLDDVPPDGRVF
jgi:hypothetical protein